MNLKLFRGSSNKVPVKPTVVAQFGFGYQEVEAPKYGFVPNLASTRAGTGVAHKKRGRSEVRQMSKSLNATNSKRRDASYRLK